MFGLIGLWNRELKSRFLETAFAVIPFSDYSYERISGFSGIKYV